MNCVISSLRQIQPVIVLVLTVFGASLWAGEWLSAPRGIERYAHIWESMPFAAASNVSPAGNFLAERYAVTGFASVGTEDLVFIFDRTKLERFSVTKSQAARGVELLGLENTDNIKNLKARVRVEGETTLLSYEPDIVARAGAMTDKKPSGANVELSQQADLVTPQGAKKIVSRRVFNLGPK